MKERSALAGSLIAGLLASVCCIGPLVLGAVGLGSMGLATALAPFRPWFLGLTVVLIGIGFFYAYRSPAAEECAPGQSCAAPVDRRSQQLALWVATLVALVLATFPSWGTRLAATKKPSSAIAPASATVVFDVRGMTCPACASEIELALMKVPRVVRASASFDRSSATVQVLTPAPSSEVLIAAIERTGYRASLPDRRMTR